MEVPDFAGEIAKDDERTANRTNKISCPDRTRTLAFVSLDIVSSKKAIFEQKTSNPLAKPI